MFTVETKTATITGATANGTTIVYSATNTFVAGEIIHISGIIPSNLNLPDAVITSRTNSTFTVSSTETGTYVSGGTAVYDELKNHTITNSTVRAQTLVVAEWNMNLPSNISKIGNYRYRPTESGSPYYTIETSYDSSDANNDYTDATNSDVLVDAGYEDDMTPYFVTSQNQKYSLFTSLEDCFGKNRPRSGINKAMFFTGRKIPSSNDNMALRPRYYAASKDDAFKYWCSFRTEVSSNVPKEVGISFSPDNYINDAAPFIVYTDSVPANRVVVKMQTHVGSYDMGNNDPFYGDSNKQTPSDWKIEKLNGTSWEAIATGLTDSDINSDGYVELEYGVDIPAGYETTFYYAGNYSTSTDLPAVSTIGAAYLVGSSSSVPGSWYIWNGSSYDSPTTATYSWKIHQEEISRTTPFVTDLTSPSTYGTGLYREFDYLDGLRIVVAKMKNPNIPFELIELSPRLAVNLSDKTIQFSVKKHASDLGNSGMPVGQLLAGTGELALFDYDQAFNSNNTDSIVNNFIARNIQVKLYEIVLNVNSSDYYMPIKTMNCDGFPEYSTQDRTVNLQLRDQFTMFESMAAPEIFIRDVSLSFAISTLLDSIGFSNYVFKRVSGTSDPVIPFFFIAPQTSVAEVLQDLAVSTQHMMFFDEYNNFVVMSKEYAMPTVDERSTDFVLYGSQDYTTTTDGLNNSIKFKNTKLSNILDINSKTNDIYNAGKINYSSKSIQRSIASTSQAYVVDNYQTWVYKPVLLWEASPEQLTKTINEVNNQTGGYALTAIPLNSTLSENAPVYISADVTGLTATLTLGAKTVTVTSTANLYAGQTVTRVSGTGTFGSSTVTIASIDSATQFTVSVSHTTAGSITFKGDSGLYNNIMDFGEGVYWLPRYNGYFYANGEIIKYDSVEYVVEQVGNVWISSALEYSNYFSKVYFGKKIYPTGRVRIYSKINKDGTAVERHGRAQFGTAAVEHSAGIASSWKTSSSRKGFEMQSQYLFDSKTPGSTTTGAAGVTSNATSLAQASAKVEGVIKNTINRKPGESNTGVQSSSSINSSGGSVQASALVLSGPSLKDINAKKIKPRNIVTYIPKELSSKYVHFGTRLRIVGRRTNNPSSKATDVFQQVDNAVEFYDNSKITGGSAGLGIMIDKSSDTNNGYYFEIAALSYDGTNTDALDNVFFYKVKKDSSTSKAIPVNLYSGQATILVNEGEFVGQSRTMAEDHPTVYDLAVEYEKISGSKWLRFYLYINNTLIAVVDDKDALPVKKNMAMFVRGSTKAMFENIYAMKKNYERNPENTISKPPVESINIFDDASISTDEALRKYAISGLIQKTVLSHIDSSGSNYQIYFDEFGTIMREAAYFNIKYDKAYPALTAKMSPVLNAFKGYMTSGFSSTAYGAEFMIFNCTDNVLMVGAETGNLLRIQGVTLTDEVRNTLTVDDYYNKKADFSNPTFSNANLETTDLYNQYVDIKNSRSTYGIKSFDITAKYIQDQDMANNLMGWLISKISKPRKSVGVETFGTPFLQLGDIVKLDYVDSEDVNQISLSNSRYVIYSSEYRYSESGPQNIVYLSEVQ